MIEYLLIFLGCGLGGMARHFVSDRAFIWWGPSFPYGTILANVTGSFLMGLIAIILINKFQQLEPQLRALLLVGFLGGYTTFSSFSIATLNLFESGDILKAIANIVLSVLLCILAAWVGVVLGKQI